MTTFLRDIKFGFRLLVKNPGFASVAVLALALGIGANTAIFSVIYATSARPLPYPHPEQLVVVWSRFKATHRNRRRRFRGLAAREHRFPGDGRRQRRASTCYRPAARTSERANIHARLLGDDGIPFRNWGRRLPARGAQVATIMWPSLPIASGSVASAPTRVSLAAKSG